MMVKNGCGSGELIGGRIYKGNYMSGGGFLMDALRHLIPLIKGYSKRKIVDFTGDFADELRSGTDIKEALVRSAKQSGRKIVKDLTGGKKKKKKRGQTKKITKKKADFFGI
jgi:hypothetical protein